MIRTRILLYLLLAWLISAAFQQHQAISPVGRPTESVGLKIKPAEFYSTRIATGHIVRTSENGIEEGKSKKNWKTPSGPNPIGNHRPPSRP
ncbi:Hypothetical predicted protein [Olea europaea subsp. europaea]|uniref:Uncharacterized protein n=1 Tax=Olea europaea subsp. europaea TaxID=158383 RepID=A0A8S0TU43_OLEEU|nr:Hypothetical predicted protein [Olea europaea subsp. europaea]